MQCECVGCGKGEGGGCLLLPTFINISVPAIQPGSIHCSGDSKKKKQRLSLFNLIM